MPGLLFHSPARIVQQLLIDLGHATDPDDATGDDQSYGDWPVFRGNPPDRPDNIIVVTDTVGPNFGDTQVDGEFQERGGFQLMVRSQAYEEGFRKLHAVAVHLSRLSCRHVTIELTDELFVTGPPPGITHTELTYFVQSFKQTTNVLRLGTDTPQGKRLLFSVNFHAPFRLTC